ncbi:hypothetical protein XELAEV_18013814mg, partial [Xenopus laevis]
AESAVCASALAMQPLLTRSDSKLLSTEWERGTASGLLPQAAAAHRSPLEIMVPEKITYISLFKEFLQKVGIYFTDQILEAMIQAFSYPILDFVRSVCDTAHAQWASSPPQASVFHFEAQQGPVDNPLNRALLALGSILSKRGGQRQPHMQSEQRSSWASSSSLRQFSSLSAHAQLLQARRLLQLRIHQYTAHFTKITEEKKMAPVSSAALTLHVQSRFLMGTDFWGKTVQRGSRELANGGGLWGLNIAGRAPAHLARYCFRQSLIMGKHGKPKDQGLEEDKRTKSRDSQCLLKQFFTPSEGDQAQQGPKMAPRRARSPVEDSDNESVSSEQVSLTHLKSLPTKADLADMIAQFKHTLKEEIGDLRSELSSLHTRVTDIDQRNELVETTVEALTTANSHHIKTISALQRRLDDIDNRGRRNNLRIRGLPELPEGESLLEVVTQLYRHVLDKPSSYIIDIERVHRALRPRGLAQDKPRDVICCLTRYPIKQEILLKAKKFHPLTFKDSDIMILQDLSWHTLQQRRLIQPLLASIKDKGLQFRWTYPFGIQVSKDGRSATLTIPEELPHFCKFCNIEEPDLSEWKKATLTPTVLDLPSRPEWEESLRSKNKKKKNKMSPAKGSASDG